MIIIKKLGIVKIILIILFSIFGGKSFLDYLDFSSQNNMNNIPINYVFIEKKIETAGKSDNRYKMKFNYNNLSEEVYISKKEFNMIDFGEYPKLYQSRITRTIYTDFNTIINFRRAFLSLIIIIVTVIIPSDIVDKIIKLFKLKKKSNKL